jgi:Na+-driven multidrug efflux pump
MLATGLAVWLVRLPFGWLLGVPLHGGLPGVYISNVLDCAVRAVANQMRFKRGGWQRRRV